MHIVFIECNFCLYFKDKYDMVMLPLHLCALPKFLIYLLYCTLEYFSVKLRTVGIAKSFCI